MLEFALHFRANDPTQWMFIACVVLGLIALFLFFWLRKDTTVDFLDPSALDSGHERSLRNARTALDETLRTARRWGELAYALIWSAMAVMCALVALFIVAMIALGVGLREGTFEELAMGLGVVLMLSLGIWLFAGSAREHWRTHRQYRN
jgi:uncharacterized oligopeptide transporter (OPT) family protein